MDFSNGADKYEGMEAHFDGLDIGVLSKISVTIIKLLLIIINDWLLLLLQEKCFTKQINAIFFYLLYFS